MALLPRSPRARRRIRWIALVVVLVVAGVLIAVLVPEKTPPPSTQGSPNPGVPAIAATKHYHLTAADRKAIDHALDVFLPAAMERKNLRLAWTLAGPEIRSAQTQSAVDRRVDARPRLPGEGDDVPHLAGDRRRAALGDLQHRPPPGQGRDRAEHRVLRDGAAPRQGLGREPALHDRDVQDHEDDVGGRPGRFRRARRPGPPRRARTTPARSATSGSLPCSDPRARPRPAAHVRDRRRAGAIGRFRKATAEASRALPDLPRRYRS